MSDYTPTTESVRDAYASSWDQYDSPTWYAKCQAEFDRWLEDERYRVRSEVARDIEVMASQGILNSDFRAGMLHAACIVRGETNGG